MGGYSQPDALSGIENSLDGVDLNGFGIGTRRRSGWLALLKTGPDRLSAALGRKVAEWISGPVLACPSDEARREWRSGGCTVTSPEISAPEK